MRTLLAIFAWLVLSTHAMAQTFINTVGSDDAVAIAGYDPVAFFTEKKAVPGSRDFEYTHLGAKWLFSSKENLVLFQDNPDKYIPAWGGQCAWCISENCVSTKKLSGDFEIIDGKLYLFSYGNSSKSGAKDSFLYGRWSRSARIRDGEKLWPEIKRKLEDGTIPQPNSSTYTKTKFD